MTLSIECLKRELMHGRLSLSDLLSLRRELRVPFRLHPLGFLACTLLDEGTRKFRLHYWPVEGGSQQSPECQIHDHLFEFRSWVLAGSVENIEYAESSEGQEFSAYRTEYVGDRSTLTKTDRTLRLSELKRCTFSAGSSYAVPAGVLHETTRVGAEPAFTALVTTDVYTTAPLVLGPTNGLGHYVYVREVLDEKAVEAMLVSGRWIDEA